MSELVFEAIGGLGIFLLGIIILTNGLRSMAGEAMRKVLMRFTNSPLSGALTGSITTAILQSSSATTVAAVGFVGAGLITFNESLGIIFGANIGTTVTGWIVVLIGFKLKLGSLIMVLIFVGVLLKLFAKKRLATFGYTIAGFSLIFIGIDMMQNGMVVFSDFITPQQLPSDTFTGRLQLIAIGVIFTIITQSSSAGVAMALSALYVEAIVFEQAAALVIGMDVGTTITAALATIGQSVEARRTGFSHVIYNILTAVGALFLITPFTIFIGYFFQNALVTNAEISLVAFHTLFNALGLIVILPFTNYFGKFMFWLIPQGKRLFTKTLDTMLLDEPDLALTAVQNSIHIEIVALLEHINSMLGDKKTKLSNIKQLQEALNKTHNYIDEISLKSQSGAQWERLVSMIHTLDHMQRLHERCEEDKQRALTIKSSEYFTKELYIMRNGITSILDNMKKKKWGMMYNDSQTIKTTLFNQLKPSRAMIIDKIAIGDIDVEEGTKYLEAIRWLKRVSWHLVRISYHFEQALLASGK